MDKLYLYILLKSELLLGAGTFVRHNLGGRQDALASHPDYALKRHPHPEATTLLLSPTQAPPLTPLKKDQALEIQIWP